MSNSSEPLWKVPIEMMELRKDFTDEQRDALALVLDLAMSLAYLETPTPPFGTGKQQAAFDIVADILAEGQ